MGDIGEEVEMANMVIVCAIGLRRGPELFQRLAPLTAQGPHLLLVHVIDVGPRQRWEQVLNPFRPGPKARAERHLQMEEAEQRSGETILAEAQTCALQLGFVGAVVRLEQGNPERELLHVAQETGAALMVVFARELLDGHPAFGPASVGHTARFLVDHAPCPVLLLR
jgi:nucleotide-binding universal stress UspA family protein